MTPKWEHYFWRLCREVATNSSCMSRQIGAIIVREKSVVATGYNGPPRGVPDCDVRCGLTTKMCPRRAQGFKSGEGLHLCVAAHAEANAIVNAARLGVQTKGTHMFVSCGVPCKNCLALIINAGIFRVTCTGLNWYDEESKFLVRESGLEIEVYGGDE